MKKELNGIIYDISEIDVDHHCECDAIIEDDRDGISIAIESYGECYESNTITINGIGLYHECYGQDGVKLMIESDKDKILPKEYDSLDDFLADLLGEKMYSDLTRDSIPNTENTHKEKTLTALADYMQENNLVAYKDDMRGFGNEWCIYLADADTVVDNDNLYRIDNEKVIAYVSESFDYDDDYSSLRLWQSE